MGAPLGPEPGTRARPRAVPALLVKEHEVPLAEGETLIGRGGDAKISIMGSLVSRVHARLVRNDNRVTFEDLGSRNGVFVNGLKLEAPALLEDGDTLLIGTTQLTYFLGTPDEGEPMSARVVFDEQGNMVPESEVGPEWNARTAINLEAAIDDTLDYDGSDVTIQGALPPSPRLASALLQKPDARTDPPPTPRGSAPVAPGSGSSPRALPIGRVRPEGPPSRPRPSAPPLVGPMPRQTPFPPAPAARRTPFPSTPAPPRSGAFSVPGQDPLLAALSVIDRMLARGDADAAGRALSGHLAKRVQSARAGAPLAASLVEEASFRCLSLLELTGEPGWFDAIVELHCIARAAMTHAVLDRLTPFVGVVPSASQGQLFEYQGIVRELLGEVDVEALDACERVLALDPG